MSDNRAQYGFRFFKSRSGSAQPDVEQGNVASGASFDTSGSLANFHLRKGDLVYKNGSGEFALRVGSETGATSSSAYGVVQSIEQYWDGEKIRSGKSLPSDITYSGDQRATRINVIPLESAFWEVDVDDVTTCTTFAAYQAVVGRNVDWRYSALSTDAAESGLKPVLDISGHNTTAALPFRIHAVSPTLENVDFSGANVKLIVLANTAQNPPYNTTGF